MALPTSRATLGQVDRFLLYGLYGFTLVAVAGFGVFGLNPELLGRWPGLAPFYVRSFSFFARLHVLLTALVIVVYLARRVGLKWVPAAIVVYALSLLSETLGTTYGLPFGSYRYTALLGEKWFGRVPYLIPLSWFVMAVPCFALAYKTFPERRWFGRVLLATYLLVVWDLSLDPAMSYLTSYWTWEEKGLYYGMPLINLAGWALTGLGIMITLELMRSTRWAVMLDARWMTAFYGAVLLMPLGMLAAAGLWGAVGATLGALALAWGIIRRGRRRLAALGRSATSGEQAAQFENDPSRFFARHARSFAFAARFFPSSFRREVVLLYGFCRLTDDLIDAAERTVSPELLHERFKLWQQCVQDAYDGRPSRLRWLDELMQRSRASGLPWVVVQALLDGVRSDIGPVRLRSYPELDHYAYCVGSTVGLWMCYLMGITEPNLLKRAEALGRAMQYTNIVRDVGEDLLRNRIYLPAERLAAYGLDEATLRQMQQTGILNPAYPMLLEEIMQRAEHDYAAAWEAVPALPSRMREAIAVALELYQGIHRALRRNSYNNLTRRAYISMIEKSALALHALWRLHGFPKLKSALT
ncbi:carotenoid biosynthesis protein [Rhodothermus bifroesti]|uniref:carotenoid biosynthesis protein n=1 Tax=Rhodothermus bifroesti TaxID=2823335 RepID=UPI001AF000E7|nr:carotenoid biosynthesis protein [Rhodothermus bifroesti]